MVSGRTDLNEEIEYKREGGCFVTTKKALFCFVLALGSFIGVIVLMYFYGPNRTGDQDGGSSTDIEKLLNESTQRTEDHFRLPISIRPLYYRLYINPVVDQYSVDNFTFNGTVKILISATEKTKQIVLHSDDLRIHTDDVSVYTVKILNRRSESNGDAEREDSLTTESGRSTEIFNTNSTITINDSYTTKPTVSVNHPHTTPSRLISTSLTVSTEAASLHTKVTKDSTSTTAVTSKEVQDFHARKIEQLAIKKTETHLKQSKFIITLEDSIEPDVNYTVEIRFSGNISDDLIGLYRTSYVNPKGEVRWLATTFFQPTFARRAFPCFDEPALKAPFEISVARRTNMTVLSNMPLKETEIMSNATGWVWDHFEPSPPMSTYLVAFTVSDFASLSVSNIGGPVLKLWGGPHVLKNVNYSLIGEQKIVNFMESYFDIKFPLPKLDLVVIPNFPRASMSNWGLIYLRHATVLLEESAYFTNIAKALSQQWFGDLVTMRWWSDLWLGKGFATYISRVAQHTLHPEQNDYNNFILAVTQPALLEDSMKTTHSLHVNIQSETQIEQVFDDIEYEKGASILRMLNITLTERVFQKGLRTYLKNWSFKSTTRDALCEAFSDGMGNHSVLPKEISFKDFIDTWTAQDGYPIIQVNRNYTSGSVNLTQRKLDNDDSGTDALWIVPISYATDEHSNLIRNTWLFTKESFIENVTRPGHGNWLLFNIEQTGFYRVNYDPENWNLLLIQLQKDPNKIPVSNRAQILNDAFALANLNLLNYSRALNLTKYLPLKENHSVPWTAAVHSLEDIKIVLQNSDHYRDFQDFVIGLVKNKFHALGTDDKPGESTNDRNLRKLVVETACEMRYEPCVRWARDQYQKWMDSVDGDLQNPIPPHMQYVVQCTSIYEGNEDDWDFLLHRTRSPPISPAELMTAYLSLGCTPYAWLIHRYLALSLSGNITVQNVPYVWESLTRSTGLVIGFKFLRDNWKTIYDAYNNDFSIMKAIMEDFLSRLSSKTDLEDLTTFYKTQKDTLDSNAMLLKKAVDVIKMRIRWSDEHLYEVLTWLRQK